MIASNNVGGIVLDPLSLLHSPMVTVRVGPDLKPYGIHKSLVCHKSPYFDSAFNRSSQETSTQVLDLGGVSVSLFNIFVSWLYSGRLVYAASDGGATIKQEFDQLRCLDIRELQASHDQSGMAPDTHNNESSLELKRDDSEQQNPEHLAAQHGTDQGQKSGGQLDSDALDDDGIFVQLDREDARTWSLDVLAKLFILGDHFEVRAFRNIVINAMIERTELKGDWATPSYALICFVYSNSAPKSVLKDIMIHLTAYRKKWEEPPESWNGIPPEFLQSVMVTLGRRLPVQLCKDCYANAIEDNNIVDACIKGLHKKKDLPPFEVDKCFYHEHTDQEERDACRRESRARRKSKQKQLVSKAS